MKIRLVIAVILSACLCSCAGPGGTLPPGTYVAAGTGKQVVKTDVGGLTPKQAATAFGQQVLAQLAVLGLQYGTAQANAYLAKHLPKPVVATK